MIRRVLFWLHLLAGVVAGTIVFIMCVTGALLTFQQSVLALVERGQRVVAVPEGARPLSADDLIGGVRAARPDVAIASIAFEREPDRAVAVGAGAETLFVNPYTGEILGTGAARARAFYRSVTNWHRWLAREGESRTTARAITGACNAAFLVLAVTGLYLWLPRQWTWRHVSPVLWFRRGLRGKARDFNWHNAIGLWSAPVLMVLTTTGMVISYPWASSLVYTLTGSPVPAGRGGGPGGRGGAGAGERGVGASAATLTREATPGARAAASAAAGVNPNASPRVPLETLAETARRQMPTWSTLTLRFASQPGAPVTASLTDGEHWNAFARSSLTLDAASGAIVRWEPYAASSAGQKLRGWMRFAHTGELGGRPGELIAGLACVGGAFLVYTGLALSLRRFAAWRARARAAAGVAARRASRPAGSGAAVLE
jgi:uncharacterized iron-regulated membrane protein